MSKQAYILKKSVCFRLSNYLVFKVIYMEKVALFLFASTSVKLSVHQAVYCFCCREVHNFLFFNFGSETETTPLHFIRISLTCAHMLKNQLLNTSSYLMLPVLCVNHQVPLTSSASYFQPQNTLLDFKYNLLFPLG